MKLKGLICIAIVSLITGCAIESNVSENVAAAPSESSMPKTQNVTPLDAEPTPEPRQFIEHKGASLQNKIPAASGLIAAEEKALYLEEESDKPDSVVPNYLSLKFRGRYASTNQNSSYQPEVNIYPIEEFRTVLGKSKTAVEYLDKGIEQLKTIISSRPKRLKNVPRIPLHDGSPTTITHVKYVQFANGSGVQYLTHFDIEQAIIGNERLTYVMQGLTSDGRYYIFATFPVALDFLPHSDASEFRGYKSPLYFYEPKTRAANEKNYERYLSSMTALLEGTHDDRFEPTLTSIQSTLSTLNADWKP
jgi:hypothetical protein